MALKEEPARWDQEALRPQRWFSRAGRQRAAVPSPFDDQDAFDAFVGSLRAKIEHQLKPGLSNRLQLEIGDLIRVLNTMPRAVIYRNRAFFEMAFDLIAAEHPNLVLIAQIRQTLSVTMEQSVGVGRLITATFGNTPLQTVVCGVLSTFLLLFTAVVLLDQAHALMFAPGSPMKDLHPIVELMGRLPTAQIIVLMVAAFTGAVVSVLARFRYFLDCARTAPLLVYVTVTSKPFVSIAFAGFIYAIVACGLVTLPGITVDQPGDGYIVWVIGFLSGFSERFVRDFVGQADRIAGADPIPKPAHAPKEPES